MATGRAKATTPSRGRAAAGRRIIVLGAGGNSLAIVDAIQAINSRSRRTVWRLAGFLDDLPQNRGRQVMGVPVLGRIADAASAGRGCVFINGISSVASFRKIAAIVARTGMPLERFESIVHPDAVVSKHASLGRGSAIMAGSVLCPESAVGNHVIMLQNSTLNHHSRLADHVTVSAGVTILGYVEVADSGFIGGGSSLAPFVKVGRGALVGMGSVVIRDVPAGKVVAGSPARVLAKSQYTA